MSWIFQGEIISLEQVLLAYYFYLLISLYVTELTNYTGIWKYLNNLKVNMVIKNQVIRYRKEIKQGDIYTIATTIIGYNDKVTHSLTCSIIINTHL